MASRGWAPHSGWKVCPNAFVTSPQYVGGVARLATLTSTPGTPTKSREARTQLGRGKIHHQNLATPVAMPLPTPSATAPWIQPTNHMLSHCSALQVACRFTCEEGLGFKLAEEHWVLRLATLLATSMGSWPGPLFPRPRLLCRATVEVALMFYLNVLQLHKSRSTLHPSNRLWTGRWWAWNKESGPWVVRTAHLWPGLGARMERIIVKKLDGVKVVFMMDETPCF
jgi:hypothetical protein